jgi:hypothetical protein
MIPAARPANAPKQSRSENLLQVFRYRQVFGSHNYEDLNRLFKPSDGIRA